MHFLPEDYIYSQTHRRLKYNAVPNINICNIQTVNTEMNDTSMTEQHSRSIIRATDNELHLQCNINTIKLLLQSKTNIQHTNVQHSGSETNTTELLLQSETNITELHLQSQTSNESNETSSNFICAETSALQNDQNHIKNNNTNNCPSTPKTSKNILGSITRQRHLTKSIENI